MVLPVLHVEEVSPEGDDTESETECEWMRKQNAGTNEDFTAQLMHECCSQCRPPPSCLKKGFMPMTWHHVPWDEVEMKRHDLVDRHCHHIGATPPADEVMLKRLGYVNTDCEHFQKMSSSEPCSCQDTERNLLLSEIDANPRNAASKHSPTMVKPSACFQPQLYIQQLSDGCRLIHASNSIGCQLLVVQDTNGSPRFVGARCCGKNPETFASAPPVAQAPTNAVIQPADSKSTSSWSTMMPKIRNPDDSQKPLAEIPPPPFDLASYTESERNDKSNQSIVSLSQILGGYKRKTCVPPVKINVQMRLELKLPKNPTDSVVR